MSRYRTNILFLVLACGAASVSVAQEKEAIAPRRPIVVVTDLRADEQPIEVHTEETVLAENPFYKRVRTSFTFVNPNARVMAGDFEFPISSGAIICGYSLEINGEMVPGVVCEKEKARVAFENEMRKGVDPGLVEQVKGHVWRTRIFPLNAKTPRRATVDMIVAKEDAFANEWWEKDGADFFVARKRCEKRVAQSERVAAFEKGTILWDASLSAKEVASAWLHTLAKLPETGEWTLITFRHTKDAAKKFTSRAMLIKALEETCYDGGTRLKEAFADVEGPILFFSDEIATMDDEQLFAYEKNPDVVIASRADAPSRAIDVEKVAVAPAGIAAEESRLLATVWAANRMNDLSTQADARKDEFLALGRAYGVAGEGLSLIVLETLQQWLDHDIEPPATLRIHDEWMKRKAAEDDAIRAKKVKAQYDAELLAYWEERVKWWNHPKPEKRTPSSGLFNGSAQEDAHESDSQSALAVDDAMIETEVPDGEAQEAVSIARPLPAPVNGPVVMRAHGAMRQMEGSRQKGENSLGASSASPATVKVIAWNPAMPYVKALNEVSREKAYDVYLKERERYAASPAFYLDCASWFYQKGEMEWGDRIITNLAEFKLEDAALWRTMGWRLREAKRYALACDVFAKVKKCRGEEGQSFRDLALIKMEWGKALFKEGHESRAKEELEEAMKLFHHAIFELHARRSGRRGNDLQVSILALEELNGLITWCEAQTWQVKPVAPSFDMAYRRDLPMDLRIVMSWNADETDIDLHVLEPNGEEAFYGHRRTSEGGFVSEDVVTGYGPEEYLRKEAQAGVYKCLCNYFASHQTALTGATVVTVTIYTQWGRANETMQVITTRLNKPREKYTIGDVTF